MYSLCIASPDAIDAICYRTSKPRTRRPQRALPTPTPPTTPHTCFPQLEYWYLAGCAQNALRTKNEERRADRGTPIMRPGWPRHSA